MKAVVLGGSGELGLELTLELSRMGHEVRAFGHAGADVTRIEMLYREFERCEPDVVFNCAGILRGAEVPASEFVAVNALGPYNVAEAAAMAGARMVQISTDCVFSGRTRLRRWNMVGDTPDADDIYGRSKALGEVAAPHVAVVRTSFVGPSSRLWAWLVASKGRVPGYTRAFWSGSTSQAVARALVGGYRDLPFGEISHLATAEPISKAQALRLIKARLGLDVEIVDAGEPHLNMALEPTIHLTAFEEALALLD